MALARGGEENLLLHEISFYNVPVKRRAFPKESELLLREALDATLSLALSLPYLMPYLFVLFPRLVLRPLLDGCQGRVAAAEFEKRCKMLSARDAEGLIRDAHDAQTARVAKDIAAFSELKVTFSKTYRAASLAGMGEVGRACKVAFTYGI